MLFSPIFLPMLGITNAGEEKSNKLSGTSHYFSDIMKVHLDTNIDDMNAADEISPSQIKVGGDGLAEVLTFNLDSTASEPGKLKRNGHPGVNQSPSAVGLNSILELINQIGYSLLQESDRKLNSNPSDHKVIFSGKEVKELLLKTAYLAGMIDFQQFVSDNDNIAGKTNLKSIDQFLASLNENGKAVLKILKDSSELRIELNKYEADSSPDLTEFVIFNQRSKMLNGVEADHPDNNTDINEQKADPNKYPMPGPGQSDDSVTGTIVTEKTAALLTENSKAKIPVDINPEIKKASVKLTGQIVLPEKQSTTSQVDSGKTDIKPFPGIKTPQNYFEVSHILGKKTVSDGSRHEFETELQFENDGRINNRISSSMDDPWYDIGKLQLNPGKTISPSPQPGIINSVKTNSNEAANQYFFPDYLADKSDQSIPGEISVRGTEERFPMNIQSYSENIVKSSPGLMNNEDVKILENTTNFSNSLEGEPVISDIILSDKSVKNPNEYPVTNREAVESINGQEKIKIVNTRQDYFTPQKFTGQNLNEADPQTIAPFKKAFDGYPDVIEEVSLTDEKIGKVETLNNMGSENLRIELESNPNHIQKINTTGDGEIAGKDLKPADSNRINTEKLEALKQSGHFEIKSSITVSNHTPAASKPAGETISPEKISFIKAGDAVRFPGNLIEPVLIRMNYDQTAEAPIQSKDDKRADVSKEEKRNKIPDIKSETHNNEKAAVSGFNEDGKAADDKQDYNSRESNINSFQPEKSLRSSRVDLQPAIAKSFEELKDNIKNIHYRNIINEFSNLAGNPEDREVLLKITPDDLGKVKIRMNVSGSQVHINVEVENEIVKNLIHSSSVTLKQAFINNGLQLNSLNISLSQPEQKPSKSYTSKRKSTYESDIKEIYQNESLSVPRKMGYNTYEFLA